ncbi:MAG: MFS transporter [Candidatus Thorarchaeota archaeon]
MKKNKHRIFVFILGLYFTLNFSIGILPGNITNLLSDLSGSTQSGLGLLVVFRLAIGTISLLIFGYWGEALSRRYGKKRIFAITNTISILLSGLLMFSTNYFYFLFLSALASITNGAFLPIGFTMVSERYSQKERGKRFGMLQFSLSLGNGLGIVIGGFLGWRLSFLVNFIMGIICVVGFLVYGINRYSFSNKGLVVVDSVYNYKMTLSSIGTLLKTKTILGILISVFSYGIAISTWANWGVFYLTSILDSKTFAILFQSIIGLGVLPGAIIGGQLGDIYFQVGKVKVRIIISYVGSVVGILLLLGFFRNTILFIGFLGFFLVSFATGNQFALYSDVTLPELRGTVNSFSGIVLNMGGITGNMLVSFFIQYDLLSLSITVVLVLWFLGSFSWILPYRYYTREMKSRDLVVDCCKLVKLLDRKLGVSFKELTSVAKSIIFDKEIKYKI